MNKKIIILAVLMVVGALASVLWKPGTGAQKSSMIGKEVVSSSLLPQVKYIKVAGTTGKIELELSSDNRWLIKSDQNFWADAGKVSTILDSLSKNKIRTVMPRTKDDGEEYGVGQGISVVLGENAQKSVAKISVGDRRDKGGQFIQIGEDKAVFLAADSIAVSPDIDNWEDSSLIKASADLVKSVSFKKAKVVAAREKADGEFSVKGIADDKLNKDAAKNLGVLLQNLQFSERVDLSNVEPVAAFKNPKEQVTINFFDASQLIVSVGQIGESTSMKSFVKLSFKPATESPNKQLAEQGAQVNKIMDQWFFQVDQNIATKFLKSKKDFLKSGGS